MLCALPIASGDHHVVLGLQVYYFTVSADILAWVSKVAVMDLIPTHPGCGSPPVHIHGLFPQ